jgi:dihydrofolate reductase
MQTERAWRGCVFIGVSLDGYIARADGDLSWLTDPTLRPHRAGPSDPPATVWETFFADIDTIVMGRTTYETVLGFGEWPFAGKRVIVLTTTLPEEDARVTVARSVDCVCAVLGSTRARRVYVDGGRTIRSFLSEGLIDEITVSIAPVLIGSGVRLFGELDQDVLLTLRGTHATAEDGLVRITYDVVPGGSAARRCGPVDGPAEESSL